MNRLLVICSIALMSMSGSGWAQEQFAHPAANSPTASMPMTSRAPNDYVIGEADVLRVDVWKESELSATVIVRPDGQISVPLVSEVRAAGLTAPELQNAIRERLNGYLRDPVVTVLVLDIKSKMVYITGQVTRPGAYPLLTPMNVLQLIAHAGGLTPYAAGKRIVVLRPDGNGDQRFSFDYSRASRGETRGHDIELRAGDTVVVP